MKTLSDRVMEEAMKHQPSFSVMEVLFALNRQQHPMVDVRQVNRELDRLAQSGQFVKRAAGRYEWSQ